MPGKRGRGYQINMSLFSQPNLTGGIDDAIITTSQSIPIFPIMILIFVFMVVWLGGTSNQKRRIGYADYPFWAVLAGVTTTFLALIFTLSAGIINLTTLGITIAITILCAIWFFLNKDRGEI